MFPGGKKLALGKHSQKYNYNSPFIHNVIWLYFQQRMGSQVFDVREVNGLLTR
jgi:hypothetical protein